MCNMRDWKALCINTTDSHFRVDWLVDQQIQWCKDQRSGVPDGVKRINRCCSARTAHIGMAYGS
jgi:hypothetical protein